MPTTDPRVDAYIAKSAPFAQPILKHLRRLLHKACPDATETIKWGFPCFEYGGSILCNMAAFKTHCSFGFWKASLLKDPENILHLGDKASMGHFNRITTLKDLPADKILLAYIKEASLLNGQKVARPARKAAPKPTLPIPAPLAAALKKDRKALAGFEALSPSQRRDYIEWITEARTDPTRDRRIATTLEWVAEGKSRNWKYERK